MAGKRLVGLDSLRGIAATMIIFFHVLYLGGYAEKTILTPVVSKLDIGVRLFYALSAFSLFYGYEMKIDKNGAIKDFYVGRFFRIAPLFYLCIVFYLFALPLLFNADVAETEILADVTFIFGLLPGKQESIVWAGWSIGVEWIFYFVFPLIVMLNRSLMNTIIIFVISAFVFYRFGFFGNELKKISESAFDLNFFNQFMFFSAGIVSYNLYKAIDFNKKSFRLVFPIVSIPFLWLYFFTDMINNRFGDVLIAVCFVFLILYFSCFPPKIFTNRFFISVGLSSFGLYLIHPIVLILYMQTGFLQRVHFSEHESLSYVLTFILTFILTFLLAYCSYHYYERPLMKFGKSILNKNANSK
ncbi:acyltransferase family protein [Paenibacillus auburnensis]|uniref:acyltransferase family protein n=1 Tax=Paenibacillus auburnensis TaxID=2905649 RepID=UPI001F49058B|nr:acyltransferase [Paenibacillus auburnensis]